jgi:hypothetical protein
MQHFGVVDGWLAARFKSVIRSTDIHHVVVRVIFSANLMLLPICGDDLTG